MAEKIRRAKRSQTIEMVLDKNKKKKKRKEKIKEKKKQESLDENFHMGIAFKIAGEQDTKKGNTGTMIFTTVVYR